MTAKVETPTTPAARLKKAKGNLHYWQGMARMDTASLRRTLQKVAEVEMVCAQIEEEIRQINKRK